ncbi:MAG: thioredoxin domain-containing protein [Myxococcales bacterium]|nr:thioredoxin domain-containing protein [Myxococcales bacterium]
MRKVLLSITAAALLLGCQQDKKDPAWNNGARPQGAAARGPVSGPVSGDAEARIARLEKKLDKISAFLKQAVPPELDTNQTYAVPIEPNDPVIGAKDAKVTIVEAYEFLCPYCAMIAPTMEQLLAAYPNDVRIVSKYMLIHGAPAAPAGLAMCAAGKQGKQGEMQKALWGKIWPQGPGNANRDQATPEAIAQHATELGLNVEQFKTDMNGPECQAWMQQSGRTLQQFGVGGTPSFFINGKPAKAGDLASFKALVDEELKTATNSGIPAGEYYDKAIIAKGAKKAVMISPFDD